MSMEEESGITYIPFKGLQKRNEQTLDENALESLKPSRKALGKRRATSVGSTSNYQIEAISDTEPGQREELGIPPIEALSAFDDFPGIDGSLRRLHSYRRVWNHWRNAIETSAYQFRKPSIDQAFAFLERPYHPDASSPWLDPELSQLDEKLRNILVALSLQRIGAGLGLGLGWDEEMAFIVLYGTDSLATSRAVEQVIWKLGLANTNLSETDEMDVDTGPLAGSSSQPFVILQPYDFKDMQTVLKALISGFVRQYEDYLPQFPKPKAGQALAPYDIMRLKAWWRYMKSDEVDCTNRLEKRTLLVVIPALEDVPVPLLNDLILLLATELPELPFAVLTTSGLSSAYFDRLDRETRDYIRVKVIEIQCGYSFVEKVLEKVFWDVGDRSFEECSTGTVMQIDKHSEESSMESEVLMTFAVLRSLLDYSESSNPSLDSALSFIQIKLMHHFSNPLTALLPSSLPPLDLEQLESESNPSLFSKLLRSYLSVSPHSAEGQSTLEEDFDAQRAQMHNYRQCYRLAFRLYRLVEHFFVSQMNVTFASPARLKADPGAKFISMKDFCEPEEQERATEKLRALLSKINEDQLNELRNSLVSFMKGQPEAALFEEITKDIENAETGGRMAGVLLNSFDHWISDPSEYIPLSFLWILDDRDVSSPLLNPSPHYTVVAGLLGSQQILCSESIQQALGEDEQPEELPQPDVAVLFERYLEAGRLINIYDLFQSFAAVLHGRRREVKKKEEEEKERKSRIAKASKGRRQSPKKAATFRESEGRKVVRSGMEVEEEDVNENEGDRGNERGSSAKSKGKQIDVVPDSEEERSPRRSSRKRGMRAEEKVETPETPRRSLRNKGKEGANEDTLRSRSQSPRKNAVTASSSMVMDTPSKSKTRPPKNRDLKPTENEPREAVEKDKGADEEETDPTHDPEIKTRFLYALHELDYLGFFRPTGRKADHLLKTRFEAV